MCPTTNPPRSVIVRGELEHTIKPFGAKGMTVEKFDKRNGLIGAALRATMVKNGWAEEKDGRIFFVKLPPAETLPGRASLGGRIFA